MTTKNMWQSQNPAEVFYGGQGNALLTPTYTVLCAGTTVVNPVQDVASVGTAGHILTSNGAAALPSFQAGPQTGDVILINTLTANNSASIAFNSGEISALYNNYLVLIWGVTTGYSSAGNSFSMDWSTNGGASYINSNYKTGAYFVDTSGTYLNYSSTTTNVISMQDVISSSIEYAAQIWLLNIYSGSRSPVYRGDFVAEAHGSAGITSFGTFMGYNSVSTVINAVKFSFSSSNILTGKFSIYGLVD